MSNYANPADIRAARELARLTIADAARLAGVSTPTWYSYEHGRRTMRQGALEAFRELAAQGITDAAAELSK